MNKAVAEEFKIFCGEGIQHDTWLWCNRCHRCYKAVEFRKLKFKGRIFLMCYYNDCDGDLPIDSKPWNHLIEQNPALPAIPIKGKIYESWLIHSKEEAAG